MDEIINTIHKMFDMTIDHNKIEAPSHQTNYIILSSLLFLLPAIYSYINGQHWIALSLVISTALSILFWSDARYSWRRIIDRTYAKFSFLYFFITGIMYVTWLPFLIMGYTGLFGLTFCYYMSNKHCHYKNDVWWKYHIAFHFITICIQIMIIRSIITHENIL
jgi:hypothetical protein